MSPNGERAGLDRAKERQVAWDSLRVRATEILDRSDPVGLIAIGAPAGEYEDLAILAVKRLVRREPLVEAMTAMLRDDYGLDPDPAVIAAAAGEIERACESTAATLRPVS